MTDRLLPSAHSAAFLGADAPVHRLPRAPGRRRPDEFFERFEDRALVYDCFWHADGRRILLVGPPPVNLDAAAMRYEALPARQVLAARLHGSSSVAVTALSGAPEGTREISLRFLDREYAIPVQPNLSPTLRGRRILFTMSRDNDLAWIAEWARYHARVQGADSVIVFDNGSSRYAPAEVEATLLSTPELAHVAVPSWPYRYGAPDPGVMNNPFYTLFLQIASMSVVLRRYGAFAFGLLNCDIDELVATPPGTTIFDLAHRSRAGLVVMRGRFIEAVPLPEARASGRTHKDFGYHSADARRSRSQQKKWALDPGRGWVENLDVHPYMHWIRGRPAFSKWSPEGVFYRHFRAIHTGWKDDRAEAGTIDRASLIRDEDFPR